MKEKREKIDVIEFHLEENEQEVKWPHAVSQEMEWFAFYDSDTRDEAKNYAYYSHGNRAPKRGPKCLAEYFFSINSLASL